MTVIAGTANLTNLEESASTHNVSDILIHSEYEPEDFNNDIALLAVSFLYKHVAYVTIIHIQFFFSILCLLQVDPPFEFNKHIAPATLPVKNEVYAEDSSALVSGFGGYPVNIMNKQNFDHIIIKFIILHRLQINDKYGWPTFELMVAEVFIVDQVICEHFHKQDNVTVRPTNICANNLSEERGFCRVCFSYFY